TNGVSTLERESPCRLPSCAVEHVPRCRARTRRGVGLRDLMELGTNRVAIDVATEAEDSALADDGRRMRQQLEEHRRDILRRQRPGDLGGVGETGDRERSPLAEELR